MSHTLTMETLLVFCAVLVYSYVFDCVLSNLSSSLFCLSLSRSCFLFLAFRLTPDSSSYSSLFFSKSLSFFYPFSLFEDGHRTHLNLHFSEPSCPVISLTLSLSLSIDPMLSNEPWEKNWRSVFLIFLFSHPSISLSIVVGSAVN